MNDDTYPNDGQPFDDFNSVPKEQDAEEREEQSKFEKSYPIVKDLITHFKQVISDTDSISGLGVEASMPANQVQILVEANKKFRALVQSEVDNLINLEDRFLGK